MGYGFGLLNDYVHRAHETAKSKGFWEGQDLTDPNCLLAKLMLVTTEVAEAAEAVRTEDEENFTEELADICIRVFDLAGALNLNLEQALVNKMNKNDDRAHMHGKVA